MSETPATTPPRSFALRFISGKYQGGEYPLPWEREVVIGRSSELDMVLIEDMVSRKHAKLSTQGGQIVIADLGSTNGTFVNGERVKRARLKEGDRILIGTSILKLVPAVSPPPADFKEAQAQLEKAASQNPKRGGAAMQGRLEEVPLVDLLQLLSTTKKTGQLVLLGEKGEGRIHLQNGQLVFCRVDREPFCSAKKSLFRLLCWQKGAFEFIPAAEGEAEKKFPEPLSGSTDSLLMEAMYEKDELARELPALPTGPVGLALPLAGKLRELPPDELDMVQLVHDYGTVRAALDRSAQSDLAAARAVKSLLDKGVFRVL